MKVRMAGYGRTARRKHRHAGRPLTSQFTHCSMIAIWADTLSTRIVIFTRCKKHFHPARSPTPHAGASMENAPRHRGAHMKGS